jgi:hypothetical protein
VATDPKRFIKTAPRYLVDLYRERKLSVGRDILGRLLTDERMRTAWKELARHSQKDEEWLRVWGHIAHAKKQANKKSISRKSRKK